MAKTVVSVMRMGDELYPGDIFSSQDSRFQLTIKGGFVSVTLFKVPGGKDNVETYLSWGEQSWSIGRLRLDYHEQNVGQKVLSLLAFSNTGAYLGRLNQNVTPKVPQYDGLNLQNDGNLTITGHYGNGSIGVDWSMDDQTFGYPVSWAIVQNRLPVTVAPGVPIAFIQPGTVAINTVTNQLVSQIGVRDGSQYVGLEAGQSTPLTTAGTVNLVYGYDFTVPGNQGQQSGDGGAAIQSVVSGSTATIKFARPPSEKIGDSIIGGY